MANAIFFIIYSPTVFEVQSQRPLKLRNQSQLQPNQLLFLKLKVGIYFQPLLLCLLQPQPPYQKQRQLQLEVPLFLAT